MKACFQTLVIGVLLVGFVVAPSVAAAFREAVCDAVAVAQSGTSTLGELDFWIAACGR